jgi:hypothetical protein
MSPARSLPNDALSPRVVAAAVSIRRARGGVAMYTHRSIKWTNRSIKWTANRSIKWTMA